MSGENVYEMDNSIEKHDNSTTMLLHNMMVEYLIEIISTMKNYIKLN